jgi:outer membrane lipoprotein SlyB
VRVINEDQIMLLRNLGFIALLLAMTVGLSACYAPPPRHTVVYHEGAPPPPPANYGGPPPANSGGPPPANYGSSERYCQACGTVRGIDQVQMRQGNSGGGAVLGAIIGGVIGNQFGGGSGKAAATAAGVIGGAVVGNSVEENNARAASGYAWRYRVELDDGRWANVTQVNNPGFHPGDRVAVRGDHIEWLR